MATFTGTTDYTVSSGSGPSTFAGSTDYVVTATATGSYAGSTDYTVVDPTTRTTFPGSTSYVVSSRPAVFLRQGSSLVPVQLGIRQGGQIVWLSPPLP